VRPFWIYHAATLGRRILKNIGACAFVCFGILAVWQLAALSRAGNAPRNAVDIPRVDRDTLRKNAPPAERAYP
jgi:hypothetical protein